MTPGPVARSGASCKTAHQIDMHLYFLRHGEADWPDWKKSDDERPLTKRGKKEMHEVGAFLARIKARPDLMLTSPLPRASQTAEIAAEHLKIKCREEKLLAPGFGNSQLKRLIEKHPAESLMLVGHEPDFTETISALTGASLKLAKAGVALVDVNLSSGNGRLLWLFPPKIMKK
ncbi:MAG: phosphohistidine phosphatase SixA [Verrucomicrobia bacterium]|nr:MAG: phosphohistidine phosphatase SixA [Verrucomicrobiota bacterium]